MRWEAMKRLIIHFTTFHFKYTKIWLLTVYVLYFRCTGKRRNQLRFTAKHVNLWQNCCKAGKGACSSGVWPDSQPLQCYQTQALAEGARGKTGPLLFDVFICLQCYFWPVYLSALYFIFPQYVRPSWALINFSWGLSDSVEVYQCIWLYLSLKLKRSVCSHQCIFVGITRMDRLGERAMWGRNANRTSRAYRSLPWRTGLVLHKVSPPASAFGGWKDIYSAGNSAGGCATTNSGWL